MDKSQEIREILSEYIDSFKERIKYHSKMKPIDVVYTKSAFSALNLAPKELYKYNSDQRLLEELVHRFLTNSLCELLEANFYSTLKFFAPERYVLSSFCQREKLTGLDFIVFTSEGNIGYRFSSTIEDTDKIQGLCNLHNLMGIECINFEDRKNRYSFNNHSFKNCYLKSILPESFFSKYLSNEIYEAFFALLTELIEYAKNEFGIRVIRQLSIHNLSDIKSFEANQLQAIDIVSLEYKDFKEKQFISNSEIKDDLSVISNTIKNNKLYLALIGESEFANCFITSEYLFSLFETKNHFDYTAVASGYFKSLEQFIYHIIINKLSEEDQNLWIKKNTMKYKEADYSVVVKQPHPYNANNYAAHIKFMKKYERYFDITLNPLINFLRNDKNSWIISPEAVDHICDLLENYSKYCRNDHFHKHNIHNFDDIIDIRNNTITLLLYLLGGYSIDLSKTKNILGMIDRSFENLYRELNKIPFSECDFIAEFEDGKEIKLFRDYHQPDPEYDDFGSLQNSKVRFAILNDFKDKSLMNDYDDIYKFDIIYISKDNMPIRIWRYGLSGTDRVNKKKYEIEW